MGSLFSVDGKVFGFLSKSVGVIYLNLLWIVFSVPIITIGASTTALFTVMIKIVRDEEGYICRDFWKAFKRNFKQSTIIWVLLSISAVVMTTDLFYFVNVGGFAGSFIAMIFMGMDIVLVLIAIYAFPMEAQFDNKVLRTIKSSLYLAFKHLGWTIVLLFLYVVTAILMYLSWFITGWVLVGLAAYFGALIYNRIFLKYIKRSECESKELAVQEEI